MRRHELEITEAEELEALIWRAQICRIGLSENDNPYIVPMNFGYKDNCLFFHCAADGKKLDIIRHNQKVCFEMDTDYEIVKPEERPCRWSAKYRSVIGFGTAFIIDDLYEKSTAMNNIAEHYGSSRFDFSEEELVNVCIIKVQIESITGKKAGY